MDRLKARSIECRTRTPKSPEELFAEKQNAWNDTPESRHLVLNNEQMSKLSNKEFEVVLNIGNRLYGKGALNEKK